MAHLLLFSLRLVQEDNASIFNPTYKALMSTAAYLSESLKTLAMVAVIMRSEFGWVQIIFRLGLLFGMHFHDIDSWGMYSVLKLVAHLFGINIPPV